MKCATRAYAPSRGALLAGLGFLALAGLPSVPGTQATDAASAPTARHTLTITPDHGVAHVELVEPVDDCAAPDIRVLGSGAT